MEQNNEKPHPNAGNISHPVPQPNQRYPWYAIIDSDMTMKEKETPIRTTLSRQPAVSPSSQSTNLQETWDLSHRRQKSGESTDQQSKTKQIVSPGQLELNHLSGMHSMQSKDLSKSEDRDQKLPRWNRTFRSALGSPRQSEIRDSALKRYQQLPTGDPAMFAKGFLAWPISELPSAAPGSTRELDDIRLQLQCHIVYDKDMQVFKIFSAGKDGISGREAVESALVDIRKKLHQRGSNRAEALKVFLARLPKDHTLRLVREFAANNRIVKGTTFEEQDAILRLKKIDGAYIPNNWPTWSKKLESIQVDVFRLALLDRLAELVSIGEDVHLRVRMGICVFKNYLWESKRIQDLPIIAFVESFEHDKTDAILCSLNDDALLLRNILQRNDLLRGAEYEDLVDLQPIYEILFDIASKGESKAIHQLHISAFRKGGEVTQERNWRKFIDRNKVGQALEVFMVNFGGEQSWKLQVDATPRVSIPGDEERNFAASVRLKDLHTNTRSPSNRLCFDFAPNNNVRTIRQKTIWRAVMRSNSRWVVEIAKYDAFVRNQTGPAWIADSSRWDVSIYHRQWNMVSTLTNQTPDGMISSLLLPDDEGRAANEAVKSFCRTITEASDALSFWPHSVV